MSMSMHELHCDLLGILHVTVHKATDLLASDISISTKPSSDPYCKISLEDTVSTNPKIPHRCEVNGSLITSTEKTKVLNKTVNPEWEQSFKLPVLADSMCLKALVLDHDLTSGDDFLGMVKIDILKDILLADKPTSIVKKTYTLTTDDSHKDKKVTGSVELSMSFDLNQNTVVSLTVLDGVDMPTTNRNAPSKVKLTGQIVDASGVKSKGTVSPVKNTHDVIFGKTPTWNSTMYMDHKPSFDGDIIRMKIIETPHEDCLTACCRASSSPSKELGQIEIPVKELMEEQLSTEVELAKAGKYGPKYLTKELEIKPTNPGSKKSGKVRVLTRYMTPSIRAAVRAAKRPAALAKEEPKVATRAATTSEADKAAALAKAKAKAEEEAKRRASAEADKAEAEKRRLAALAAQKSPPVVKTRGAPSAPAAEPAKKESGVLKKVVRMMMFVAGSQMIKSKFEHERTTTSKSDTFAAAGAGVLLSQLPIGPLRNI